MSKSRKRKRENVLMSLSDKRDYYIVASPAVVSDDMLDRIVEKLERGSEPVDIRKKTRITGGSVGLFGFSAGIQTLFKPELSPKGGADLLSTQFHI